MSIWNFFGLQTTMCQGSGWGELKLSLPGSVVRRGGPPTLPPRRSINHLAGKHQGSERGCDLPQNRCLLRLNQQQIRPTVSPDTFLSNRQEDNHNKRGSGTPPISLPFIPTLFLVDNGWKWCDLHLWCESSSLCWEMFDGSHRPHKRGTRSRTVAWRGAGKGETTPWRLLIRSHLSYGAQPLILIGMPASVRLCRLRFYDSKCTRAINLNK